MSTAARVAWACAVLGWFCAPPAAAQPGNPSHRPLPGSGTEGKDLRELLAERLELLEKAGANRELIRRMLEDFRSGTDVREFAKRNPVLQDPKRFEELTKFLKDQLKPHGAAGAAEQLEKLKQQLERFGGRLPPEPPGPDGPGGGGGPDPEAVLPPPPPAREEPKPPAENRRTREWTRWAEQKFGALGRTEEVRDAIRELTTRDLGGEGWEFLGDLSEWEGELRDFGQWLQGEFGPPSEWDLPGFGRLSGPDLDFGRSGSYAGGSGAAASGPSGEGSWIAVIILAAAGGGALVAWWYYFRPAREARRRAAEGTFARGRWPVDPARVSTPGELVRAFEYLSLLHCGEEARTWHHRALGEGLALRQPGQAEAARELAGYYAHARYAPASEPLTGAELRAARERLVQLAGGGTE